MTARFDDFNRADSNTSLGTPSDAGAGYTILGGGTWVIASNKAYQVTGGIGATLAVLDWGTADVDISLTLPVVSAAALGLAFRVTDINNYWFVANTGTVWELHLFTTGSEVVDPNKYTAAAANGDIVRVVTSGTGTGAIQVYINGTLRITSSQFETFSSTGTKHGLYQFFDNSVRFEDLGISGGGALTSGAASFVDADTTDVNLSCTDATGGIAPYTYLWKRATTADGSYSSTGLTTRTATDTSLSAGQRRWWYLETTDSAAAVVTSNVVTGRLWDAPLVVGAIGDSNTFGFGLSAGEDPVSQCVLRLAALTKLRQATGVNRAISATKTADWLPADASDNLVDAAAAMDAANVTDCIVPFGTNDADTDVAAGDFGENLSDIVTYLLANVGTLERVWLPYPLFTPFTVSNSLSQAQLLVDYRAEIDALVNGGTVRLGDTLAFDYFSAHQVFQVDHLHFTAPGAAMQGVLWANAIDAALNGSGGGGLLQVGGMTGGTQKS